MDRLCRKCNRTLPMEKFPKDKRCVESHTGTCRDCRNAYYRKWRLSHPRPYVYRSYRDMMGKREKRTELLVSQGGICALCGQLPKIRTNGNGNNFDLDHDHQTNQFRGVLCRGCNLMVGLLERPEINLHKVMEYLEPTKMAGGKYQWQRRCLKIR